MAAEALCARVDRTTAEDVFFGRENRLGASRHHADEVEYARHLCSACPVRQKCLDEALMTPERYDRHGIRAGLLPEERKALRLHLRMAVPDTGTEWIGGRVVA